ncbi:MAG: AMP-binding protein [Kiritimatiellae bacterium]|nr:AMP-binding protein [Kiritimatiellia bacterium]
MTIRGLLEKNAKTYGGCNAFTWCQDKVWQSRTWGETYARVRDLAEGYGTRFCLEPRKDNVAIILPNCTEWIESYLAQSGAGVAVVPLDPKLHESEVEYILKDAEATVVTTDKAHLRMMLNLAPSLPKLRGVVIIDGVIFEGQKIGDTVKVIGFDKLRVSGGGAWYDAHKPEPEDVASIIYTSGTTGKPKGAMLTHNNFYTDVNGALETFNVTVTIADSLLVVLPLFHAFSFTANLMVSLLIGCELKFVESLRTVGRDINLLRPTGIMAVPLLAEKLFDKLEEGLGNSKAAQFLLKIGLRGVVWHMILKKLGGKLRFIITGGAPCPRHVLEGFRRIHVKFIEGYGLTECAPVVSVTDYRSNRIGTIGRPCKGVEVRLADKNDAGVGELQVKGPIVMKGYFHNEKATKEAFDDDWFATGDLASMDEEGYITIRGRKKALIVNREGKNIYPEEVENAISKDPSVQDIIVVGYTQGGVPGERVGAIVYPNEDWFAEQNGGVKPDWAEMEKTVAKRVQECSAELADYKRVRKVVVYREPLERTSVGKVRRVTYKGKLDE